MKNSRLSAISKFNTKSYKEAINDKRLDKNGGGTPEVSKRSAICMAPVMYNDNTNIILTLWWTSYVNKHKKVK